MPDRIIKESSCTSDTLNELSDFEERFWWRLIVNCDDFGRFDARPAVLKSRLFPLMDGKTHKNMTDALRKLASVGLVKVYEVDGRPFLQVVKWDKHQRIRAKRSKYPSPIDGACCQLPSNDSKCIRNPIQSESESNPNPNPNICAEPESASTQNAILLPLNDGSDFPVTEDMVAEFSGLYPAVDIMQELRNMRGWLLNNPKNRKTMSGIRRFINSWLSREQNKPKNRRSQAASPARRELDSDEIAAIRQMMEE